MAENYNRFALHQKAQNRELVACLRAPMDDNHHSLPRRLIELRMEHADLDNLIDVAVSEPVTDDLSLRRLKKRRLLLRDQISRIEAELEPPQPA
jgi:hypothetical protein